MDTPSPKGCRRRSGGPYGPSPAVDKKPANKQAKRPAGKLHETPSAKRPAKSTSAEPLTLASTFSGLEHGCPKDTKVSSIMHWRDFSIYVSTTLPGFRVKRSGDRVDRTFTHTCECSAVSKFVLDRLCRPASAKRINLRFGHSWVCMVRLDVCLQYVVSFNDGHNQNPGMVRSAFLVTLRSVFGSHRVRSCPGLFEVGCLSSRCGKP